MSQKILNLCLERYNFVKFGETTKSSHTVLCINNAHSVNSDKYRLTPTAIASKHGEGFVFTLNYDFDRPLFTIVQKSYSIDGTSGNIVFEGIDPISKGGSKYLRKVTVSPVKLSDGSYLLEVTSDEYLRIGTTGAALGDEDLESLNEKIVTAGGISKSVETVNGKKVLKLDAGGPSGAKEIVYYDIDPTDPPSGLYNSITETLSNDKEPVIRVDGAVYFYNATGNDKYIFVGGYTKEAVGYTEITVSDDDSVTSKSVNDKVFNMYLLYKTDPASPGDPPGDEDYWICDETEHVITKNELVAAHADGRYFVLNNSVIPGSNSRKYFAAVTNIKEHYVQLRFYMLEYSGTGGAFFYQKTVSDDSEGRLYISYSYSAELMGPAPSNGFYVNRGGEWKKVYELTVIPIEGFPVDGEDYEKIGDFNGNLYPYFKIEVTGTVEVGMFNYDTKQYDAEFELTDETHYAQLDAGGQYEIHAKGSGNVSVTVSADAFDEEGGEDEEA